MAKSILNIVENVLNEKADESKLKIFYNSDIFLRRTEQQRKRAEEKAREARKPDEEETETEEETQEESVEETTFPLMEGKETFRVKTKGVYSVPNDDAKTILTLEDLLAYVDRIRDDAGNEITNELTIEIVRAMTSNEDVSEEISKLLQRNDKINLIIDYGFSEEDSIGLQLNKNSGVDDASLVMRQNGSPVSGQFNPEMFKTKITNIFLKEID